MENENLQFDEKLSDAVREYPCLYDKMKKDYKDVNVNRNAWSSVAEQMSIENGKKCYILFSLTQISHLHHF